MSWGLRQSSWLQRRIYQEDGAEIVGLHAADGGGALALTGGGELTSWRRRRAVALSERWGQGPPRSLALVANAKNEQLALIGVDGARLWSMKERREIAAIAAGPGGMTAADFDVDGALISGGRDGCWRRWPANSRDSLAAEVALETTRAHERPIRALAAHPAGGYLVSAGGDHYLRLWALAPGNGEMERAD